MQLTLLVSLSRIPSAKFGFDNTDKIVFGHLLELVICGAILPINEFGTCDCSCWDLGILNHMARDLSRCTVCTKLQ